MRFAQPILKGILTVAIFLMVILVPLKIVPMVQHWLEDRQAAGTKHAQLVQDEKRAELAHDQPDTLIVDDGVYQSLGMTLAQVETAVAPEPLKLDGALYLLSNSMVHVHSRFAGDVVEVGWLEDPLLPAPGTETAPSPPRTKRSLQFGDFVHEGQLLAVVWSKELGEKKSELVDAMLKLDADRKLLERLEAVEKGVVAEKLKIEARRNVQAGAIAVRRAEQTLRSWRLTDDEIDEIEKEAEEFRRDKSATDYDKSWARVEVRAFVDGTIVEKNVAVGDYVASDLDLYKIADLSRMDVLAHAYEEDVPIIERIPLKQRDWTIFLKADPKEEPLTGSFDRVLPIIDPTQHTALVRGWVDNAGGRLRVGQFITARINLPHPPNEVSIPVSALVDQDGQTFVFVRMPADPHRFTRRKVFPVRRRNEIVSLSCHSRAKAAGSRCETEPLEIGDWVVTTGGLQLAADLTNLQSQTKAEATADVDAAKK